MLSLLPAIPLAVAHLENLKLFDHSMHCDDTGVMKA